MSNFKCCPKCEYDLNLYEKSNHYTNCPACDFNFPPPVILNKDNKKMSEVFLNEKMNDPLEDKTIEEGKIINSYYLWITNATKTPGIGIGVSKTENTKFICPSCKKDTKISDSKFGKGMPENIEFKSTKKLYCLLCVVASIDKLAADGMFEKFELI